MYPRYAPAHIRQTASSPRKRGGGLPVFLLPPLGVIVAGMLVVFLSGNSLGFRETPLISPVGTASPGVLATFFTPEVQYWGAAIEVWSNEWQIDANLIAAVMQIESCGDPQAVSASGASGLFQVMPFHFKPGENPYDPETNAQKGLEYLDLALAASGGDARRALAGYNGGVALSNAPESTWPAETRRYAQWGSSIYQEARQGTPDSPSLREWLASGGSALCKQAHRRLEAQP